MTPHLLETCLLRRFSVVTPSPETEGQTGRPATPQDRQLPPRRPTASPGTPPVVKTLAWMPISAEVLADQTYMLEWQRETFDRMVNPWNYPDRVKWPAFVPLPRIQTLVDGLRARRRRLRDARLVLRGHAVIRDDDWDDE